MAIQKHLPATPFQIKVLDNYYSNGFNGLKAYCDAKNIAIPKNSKKRQIIHSSFSQVKSKNPKYISILEEKNDKKYGKMRDKLVSKLEGVATIYDEMVELALKDELSEDENKKFHRLKSIMSTRDMNKAVEVLGRLTGSFEPQKTEITNTFNVEWGGASPKLKDANKPIINADYEDVDEESDDE